MLGSPMPCVRSTGDASIDAPVDAATDAPLPLDADVPDADQTGDADGPEWAQGCTLARDTVLYRAIAESSLDDALKQTLCTCFSSLSPSWNAGLTELFATATPEEVVTVLDQMLNCCNFGDVGLNGQYQEAYRDRLTDGTLCYMALPYRGVDFPDR